MISFLYFIVKPLLKHLCKKITTAHDSSFLAKGTEKRKEVRKRKVGKNLPDYSALANKHG